MRRKPFKVSKRHEPVFLEAVLSNLVLQGGYTVLDGTVGSGGHAKAMLEQIGPNGLLIGLDQDEDALLRSTEYFRGISTKYLLKLANFKNLDKVLESLNISSVDAVLLDIGVSSEQLDTADRGFSIRYEGPLDMRMDRGGEVTAARVISEFCEQDLASIFWEFGEERKSRQIAKVIVERRRKQPIRTTSELKQLIESLPYMRRFSSKIHPATRVFQALRIYVNQELESLQAALPKAVAHLRVGGRFGVISFHSLEDRLVKRFFIKQKELGIGKIVTKKPIQATFEESKINPRARSAKFRVLERIA
jgi:16S rRNA (cytosine1402-N4)-methyltransferase